MTKPRHIILRQPHMQHLLDEPALAELTEAELAALEAFMAFCYARELSDPQASDIDAFTQLCTPTPDDLLSLGDALTRLGMAETFVSITRAASDSLRHRVEFKGITQELRRHYKRTVSLPPEALPADWRQTLGRLRSCEAYAVSIMTRMESRLGMFAWSAQQAGLPVDLSCTEALTAFYQDIRTRSAEKDGNNGEPRWAYLRSTWEELHRFAKAHGISQAACKNLENTYNILTSQENRQSAAKFTKILRAGTASGLLAEAEELLISAGGANRPQIRHARRNHAVAMAIGVAVPARPRDVHTHHVFGKGIFFEAESDGYRFRYVPQKTSNTIPEPLDILLRPHWNLFLDALILQDHDPCYLAELRAQAIEKKRPLYVNYDGTQCVYDWYSRAWDKVADTGGQIARSLVYDEMADLGEFGIQYASNVNHHRSTRIRAKYRSENAIRTSYGIGQNAMIPSDPDDDISDLL